MRVKIIRGSRSEKYAAKACKCEKCGNLNEPKELLIFDVPPFHCTNKQCCVQFPGIVYFCLADVEVNGHSILPDIKNQREKPECIPYAFSHAQEFNDIMEKIIMGEDPIVDPLDPDDLTEIYSSIFPNMTNSSRSEGLHKLLYTGLILNKFGCRPMKGGERRPGSDSVVVVDSEFVEICEFIADGRAVIAVISAKKKFQELQFGQVYSPPIPDGTTTDHAVMLVGALGFGDRCIYMFLNSYGRQFCALLDSDGQIVCGGIGMVLFTLSCNVIVLSRSWEEGKIGKLTGTWRTDLTGIALDEEVELLTLPVAGATFIDKEFLNSGGGVLLAYEGALNDAKLSNLLSVFGRSTSDAVVFSATETDGYSLDVVCSHGWPQENGFSSFCDLSTLLRRKYDMYEDSVSDTGLRLLGIVKEFPSGPCVGMYVETHIGDGSIHLITWNEFTLEISMFRVDHPNTFRMIGSSKKAAHVYLIEGMARGSIFYLHNEHNARDIPTVLKFVLDVCRGMAFLPQKCVIHSDLKSEDLLLDKIHVVKVADFCLARFQGQRGALTAETGTCMWMLDEVPCNAMSPVQAAVIVRQRCWEAIPSNDPFSDSITEPDNI